MHPGPTLQAACISTTLIASAVLASDLQDGPASLALSALPDSERLAQLLWDRSPRLQGFRLRIAEARGDEERTHLLPNPSLDVSWNTIPVGETNPPGLDRRLANVPNYAFGVNQLFELGKRSPRQRAARQITESVLEDARAALFDTFFDVLEAIAVVATTQIRIDALTGLADDARKLTDIQRARAQKGDAAQLDVDRSALEEEKLWTSLAKEGMQLVAALRACEEVVGLRCAEFGDTDAAKKYVATRPPPGPGIEGRPDVRALELRASASDSARQLARARWIPDPTLRFGYVHDRFLEAGNQGNSLFLGITLPLPVFDQGQADRRTAEAAVANGTRTRELLLRQAKTQLSLIEKQGLAVEEGRRRIQGSSLPLAQSVVHRLEEVIRRGGAPLPDLLLARRTLGDLLTDAAELDLAAFRLSVAEARIRGDGPPTPPELQTDHGPGR